MPSPVMQPDAGGATFAQMASFFERVMKEQRDHSLMVDAKMDAKVKQLTEELKRKMAPVGIVSDVQLSALQVNGPLLNPPPRAQTSAPSGAAFGAGLLGPL